MFLSWCLSYCGRFSSIPLERCLWLMEKLIAGTLRLERFEQSLYIDYCTNMSRNNRIAIYGQDLTHL